MFLILSLFVFVHSTDAKAQSCTDADLQSIVTHIEDVRDNPTDPWAAGGGNSHHVAKWNSVLAALGANGHGESPYPVSDIHANADKWPDSTSWNRPSDYLKCKTAEEQQDQQNQQDQDSQQKDIPNTDNTPTGVDDSEDWTDYQTVVDYLLDIRDDPPNSAVKGNDVHIRKWNEVLEAIGYDTGTSATAVDAATIHANADKWPDSPWYKASTYLKWKVQQDSQVDEEEDSTLDVVPQQQEGNEPEPLTVQPRITNNGPTRNLVEGQTIPLQIIFSRLLESNESPTVTFDFSASTATVGTDYTLTCQSLAGTTCSVSGTVATVIVDGSSSEWSLSDSDIATETLVVLEILKDDISESGETVKLTVSPLHTTPSRRGYTWTLHDAPESAVIKWTRSQFEVRENNGPMSPVLRITPAFGEDITVHLTFSGEADRFQVCDSRTNGDWCMESDTDTHVIPAGHFTYSLDVLINNDDIKEPDEKIFVTVDDRDFPDGVSFGPNSRTSTWVILNDDSGDEEKDARGCVEDDIQQGELCGPGGYQVMIEPDRSGQQSAVVAEGTSVRYWLYPSPPPSQGVVRVSYEWQGRIERDPIILDVPREGMFVDIAVPGDDLAGSDGTSTIKWKTVDGSNYRIRNHDMEWTYNVEEDDPMKWYWIAETFNDRIQEGTTKTAKIAFDSRSGLPDNHPRNILKVDLDVSGCDLQTNPIQASDAPVSGSSELPCYFDIKSGGSQTIKRISEDEFEIHNFSPKIDKTIILTASVGHDSDKTDETFTMAPVFEFNRSSGGIIEDPNNTFSSTITIVDDDKLDIPSESGKDTIYISSENTPATPAGGTSTEDHLPSGWSRNAVVPTATKRVYRSQRDLTYSSDVFQSATQWGAPEKILDAVAIETTITWSKNEFLVNENNGPAQPVIRSATTVAGIEVDSKGWGYSSPPTVTITGGGGSGAAAIAIIHNGEVTGIQVTNPGQGYYNVPSVTIAGNAQATAYLTPLTKDYLIPYTMTAGTASYPADFGYDNLLDVQQPLTGNLKLDAGIRNPASHISVLLANDDIHEGDETFTVTLGPFPPGIAAGDITVATVTIHDDDPAPEPPTSHMRFLGFTSGTEEVDEGRTLTVTGRFISPVNYNGPLLFEVGEGELKGCLANTFTHLTESISLSANVETEVALVLDDQEIQLNGQSSYITSNRLKDNPDCNILMWLRGIPELRDGNDNVTQQGYTVDSDNSFTLHEFLVRDTSPSKLVINPTTAVLYNNSKNNEESPDFSVSLFGLSGSDNIHTAHRLLSRGEVVEFPVHLYRGTKENNQLVLKTLISPDLYEITSFKNQSNVGVSKVNGVYVVSWRNNRSSDEADADCLSIIGTPVKKNGTACLNINSRFPTDDELWDDGTVVIPDLSASSNKFGRTNLNTGVTFETSTRTELSLRNSRSSSTDPAQFELRSVGSRAVDEPGSGYAWIPFDVYAWTLNHDFIPMNIAFCVDAGVNKTTASYYHDYTIYSADDYALVKKDEERPEDQRVGYGEFLTGYAWDNGKSCSRGLGLHQNGTRFYIRVLSDAHDEGTETIRMRVVQGSPKANGETILDSGYVTFSIANEGPIPSAWLSRYGRAVAEQYIGAITQRFTTARTPGAQGRFAGRELTGGAYDERDTGQHDAEEHYGSQIDLRDALLNSSFQWTSASQDGQQGRAGNLSIWSLATHTDFSGNENALSLDGKVTTWMLGSDYGRGDWLIGLVAGHTSGDGDYSHSHSREDSGGRLDTSMTSVVPYARWQLADAWSAWGILGYGHGDMTLVVSGDERMDTSIDWRMVATGLQADLLATEATSLSLVSDGMWTRTSSDETQGLASSESDVTRLRLGLEGSHTIRVGDSLFAPHAEVGLRHDGGDAESGFGVEVGGGITWSDFALGLSLDVSGRALLSHEDGGFKDRGISASLEFDPHPGSALGPRASVRQDWGGQASGGLDSLFSQETIADRQGRDAESRWMAEAAWGFPLPGGRFTAIPHASLGLANGERDYTLGWRWMPEPHALDVSFGLKATRRETDFIDPDHAVGLEVIGRW